jgi:hypothetical protein
VNGIIAVEQENGLNQKNGCAQGLVRGIVYDRVDRERCDSIKGRGMRSRWCMETTVADRAFLCNYFGYTEGIVSFVF